MEKSGGRRHLVSCPGLLNTVFARVFVFISFLLISISAFSLETEITVSSSHPVAGESFSISFTFYGCEPADVSADFEGVPESSVPSAAFGSRSPDLAEGVLPASFRADALRKTLSFLSPPGLLPPRAQATTVVTIEVTPLDPGSFTTGAFAFTAAGEKIVFPPIVVFVRADLASDDAYTHSRVSWFVAYNHTVVPADRFTDVHAGSPVLILLAVPAGLEGDVFCPPPENALLEPVPTFADRASFVDAAEVHGVSFAAAFYWTPLSAGRQDLPRATVSVAAAGGSETTLRSVPCGVEVLPAVSAAPRFDGDRAASDRAASFGSSSPDAPVQPDAPVAREAPAAFSPGGISSPFELNVAARCRMLWGSGEYASAVALLRMAERVCFFYPGLAEMRKAAEAALGVNGMSPGFFSSSAFFLPFVLIPVSVMCLCAAAVSYIRRKSIRRANTRSENVRHESSRSRRQRRTPPAFLFCALAVVAALSCVLLRPVFSGGITEAAAKGGSLFHIPEIDSTPVCSVAEGSAVKILDKAGGWFYIETEFGDTGWYPFENIVVYTSGELNEFR